MRDAIAYLRLLHTDDVHALERIVNVPPRRIGRSVSFSPTHPLHMHTRLSVHIYVHTFAYPYVCIYIHISIHLYIHVYVFTHSSPIFPECHTPILPLCHRHIFGESAFFVSHSLTQKKNSTHSEPTQSRTPPILLYLSHHRNSFLVLPSRSAAPRGPSSPTPRRRTTSLRGRPSHSSLRGEGGEGGCRLPRPAAPFSAGRRPLPRSHLKRSHLTRSMSRRSSSKR